MNAWWKALSAREQRLVLGGGGALIIAVLYWGTLAAVGQPG